MGCGASVAKTNANRRPFDASQLDEVPVGMESVQDSMMNKLIQHDDHIREKHIIQIQKGVFTEKLAEPIEADDIVEFQCYDSENHDIIQVYKDGNDFYEVHNGFQLRGINRKTDVTQTQIPLSLSFDEEETELYFCVIPSAMIDRTKKQRKYPKERCEPNRLVLKKPKFDLEYDDEHNTQKIYLHQNEELKINWKSENGTAYRIEERKYCPVSAGFYLVESDGKENQRRATIQGKYTRRFTELGTSFLCRFDDRNELYDVTVCIILDSYQVRRITFKEDEIVPNIIDIEQSQIIEFYWNTKRKLTFYQIEPFRIDEKSRKSIKLQNPEENFFWPYDATRRGQMYYQFNEPGVFCFKVENGQIGTIMVHPRKTVHQISLSSDPLVQKINAREWLRFVWKLSDFTDEKICIKIDPNTSVIPRDANSLRGLFNCEDHRCSSDEIILQECVHTCEIFLINLPKHGLYQFSLSAKPDRNLFSVIVENAIDLHHAEYNPNRCFDSKTIVINQNDRVSFESEDDKQIGFIYETDEYGRRLTPDSLLFEPQPKSLNIYIKQFHHLGIFYFSVDFDSTKVWKNSSTPVTPMAIVVVPDIKFHYNFIDKTEFDSRPIMTHLNDFVIWQFNSPVSHNLVQLPSDAKLNNLKTCHELSEVGRNRSCLGLECIRTGAYFFANPEFERFCGSEEARLLSTVIIDVPFGEKCLFMSNQQFLPNVLNIAQGDTVSWTLSDERDDCRISVRAEKDTEKVNEETLIDRNLETFLDDIHHLHTFRQPGKYIVQSDKFKSSATIIVEPEKTIQAERKRVLTPEISSAWNAVTEFGGNARLYCANRNAAIYYTLDGTMPTRFIGDVRTYQVDEGVVLAEPGLHVLRAFAFENEKVPSHVMTSSPTYIMESEEFEANKMRRAMWEGGKVFLTAFLQKPNKVYGRIQFEPSELADLTNHFTLYIDDVAQSVTLAEDEIHFSAEGFTGGEQYEIQIVAYPKLSLGDASPITSNKRTFEIQRENVSGGPLLSLGVPNDLTSVFLLWANIGDHVEEYVVYVDDVATKTISESEFKSSFGIQFLGAQQNRNYLFHVEAILKESRKTCQSNVVSVRLPLSKSVQENDFNKQLPYIIVRAERAPTDAHLDEIQLFQSLHQPQQTDRTFEKLPITFGFRNAIPSISYRHNKKGITCILTEKSSGSANFAENYRLIVDGEPYGKLIAPHSSTKFQINLAPGNHECFLQIMPKDKEENTYKSNLLKINVPSTTGGARGESKLTTEQSNVPIYSVLDKRDLPITKLIVQTVSKTSIRARWQLDRPLLKDAFVAIYELHIRGESFTDQVNSDETSNTDGSIEHVWILTQDFLEIQGVSDRQEYTLFVRTYYHVNGLTDIEYAVTQSPEVTTARLDSAADFLPRPMLSVARLDVQMAVLSWKLPDTEVESLVKGYRIYMNSKPTELLSSKQNTYELKNLKPGTSNEVQVAVSASSNYSDDQISEPIRIECPQRPSPPEIEVIPAENPFSIQIQWKIKAEERDQIHSFRVFLNDELHAQVKTSGRQTFKHEFTKLDPDQTYLIYVKSFVETQKLDGYSYQCSIESNASREINRRCAAPPRGTTPRIERMYPNGVHLEWDEPEQTEEIKATGYLLLKDGRVVGKPIQINQRRASINDLDVGNRYSFQILPLTDQASAPKLRTGEVYDPKRHGYYLPGPKLDVEFTDLIVLPKKIEIENITGHTAMLCWSTVDQSISSHVQPEFYNIKIWNNKDLSKDNPKISKVLKTETSASLTDLQSETVYFIQMEACQNRRHPTTNDHYLVVTTSDVVRFQTGAPPKPPATMRLIACTNNAARLNFDPFVECRAEIIEIRVHVKPEETSSSSLNNRTLVVQLTPDKTEVILRNLIESTRYAVTLYAITQEYLEEIGCSDSSSLQDELSPSHWLSSKSISFTTSGFKPATDIRVVQSTVKAIKLEWNTAQATGSTEILGQTLRWKSGQSNETQIELNRGATKATIPGVLPSGRYMIYLDTIYRYQVNLEEAQDENNHRENVSTTAITTDVVFEVSSVSDSPELYVTGYTLKTISLEWEKPDMFSIIDHPEKAGEQIKLHRKLIGYVLHSQLANGRTEDRGKTTEFSDDQTNCELTGGLSGAEYQITLKAKTILRPESLSDESIQNRKESNEPEESPPREIKVRHLAETDILHGLHAQIASIARDDDSIRDGQTVPKKQIEVNWQLAKDAQIHSFILRWHSSKTLETHQKTIESSKRKAFIDVDDSSYFYTIYLDIIKTNKRKLQYSPVHLLVPSAPEPPTLFLVKTTDTSFTVEWSEPRTHGIPIIGYELFISGKRYGETIKVDSRQAEIPSCINRTYQVKICALTSDQSCPRSIMSPALTVITTPTTNLAPTITYHNDDGNIASFDRTVARIIPIQIESINEEKLHVQWTSFLPTAHIRAYYIHYTCLNTGEIQAMKVSKRFREAVLRGLRPGFTYGIIVIAVDKNGGVLYTSDKTTVQMNAPPNAPIVAITERTNEQVRVEWRPAASYGLLKVVGYKIFVNNRLAAILSEDQLSYTLKNGTPCDAYTIQVQALSNDKTILSPVSRVLQFNWPGIRPGAFRRVDDGQTGTILVSWDHPKFEDDTEKLIAFKLISENLLTREVRNHGEFDAATHQASIYDLNAGNYRLWLEIQGETHRIRARPITVNMTRANSSINRTISFDSTRYLRHGQNGFRQPITAGTMTGLRRSRY